VLGNEHGCWLRYEQAAVSIFRRRRVYARGFPGNIAK
jgi:hypothetical protein